MCISTKNVQSLRVDYKAGDEQLQLSVIVIVKPDGASGPAGRGDAGLISHIRERAVTVVVIKNIASITRDIDINPAIAVVIADGDTHAERTTCHSGFVGDISERAVMIVMVKRIL